jgi:hypothetical protein
MSGRDVRFVSRPAEMGEARGTMMAKVKFAVTTNVSSAL